MSRRVAPLGRAIGSMPSVPNVWAASGGVSA